MRRLTVPIFVALAAILASAAQGEVAQKGKLRVSFDGRLSPRELPLAGLAPDTAPLASSIRNVDGGDPPPLRSISIAVNRQGQVSLAGLATWPATARAQTQTGAGPERRP